MIGVWFGRIGLALSGLLVLVGLSGVALTVLPMPNLQLWAVGLLALEFSLVFGVLAAIGALLAVLAVRTRAGKARRTAGRVLLVGNMLLLVASVLPAASAWSTANRLGIDLTLTEYLAGMSSSSDRDADERVRYATVEGTDLELDVWRARGAADEPRPIVVNVHGGASDTGPSPFPRWDQWLADSGYLVFHVDYRFFESGRWQTAPGDLKCGLGWVARNAERYGGDSDRVTLMGQSAGGYLSLLAAYTDHEQLPPSCDAPPVRLDGVIAWYAPGDATSEIPSRFRLSESVRTELLQQWELTPEQWRAASPSSYLRPGLPRTLVIQGGRDLLQPPENTREFAAGLDQVEVLDELVEIPYADHQFDLSWGGFGSQLARGAILKFLE